MRRIIVTIAMTLMCMACPAHNGVKAFQSFAKHFSSTASFSYATIGGRQVMLVSQETFGNNENSDREAIDASIFALDTKGKIICLGSVRSQGTLYPVSILDGKVMVAGHYFVRVYSIRGETPELFLDSYEEVSVYEEGDNAALDAMFRTFEKAEPVLFRKSLRRPR